MKMINAFGFAILLVALIGCTTTDRQAAEADRESERNRLFRAMHDGGAVMFATPVEPGRWNVGSGFVVVGTKCLYLGTAWHVATNFNPSTKVLIRGASDSVIMKDLASFSSSSNRNSMLLRAESDAALIPISRASEEHLKYITVSLLSDLTNSPSLDLRGTRVWLAGFPEKQNPAGTLKQIYTQGHVASEIQTNQPPYPTPYFLVTPPGARGMSGGMVYVAPKTVDETNGQHSARATIVSPPIGFLSGTRFETTSGKFAVVTPISVIGEMIHEFESQIQQAKP